MITLPHKFTCELVASNISVECPVFVTGPGARDDSMEGSCRAQFPGHL